MMLIWTLDTDWKAARYKTVKDISSTQSARYRQATASLRHFADQQRSCALQTAPDQQAECKGVAGRGARPIR